MLCCDGRLPLAVGVAVGAGAASAAAILPYAQWGVMPATECFQPCCSHVSVNGNAFGVGPHCQQATAPGISLDGSRHAGCLAISLRDMWPSGIAVSFFMPVVWAINAPCALTCSRNVGLYRACGFRLMALPFHMKGENSLAWRILPFGI